MAIAGNSSYVPAVRVSIYQRKLRQSSIAHNVPRMVLWQPDDAAARLIDVPDAHIYVPTMENGGTHYLAALLVELDLIDEFRKGVATDAE